MGLPISKLFPALAIYVASPDTPLDQRALRAKLVSMGFLGEPLAKNSFLSGKRFFDHISFIGCAPNLPLTPEEGNDYLSIVILALDEPALFLSEKVRPVSCAACNGKIEDWVEYIILDNAPVLACPQCQEATLIQNLHFRKRACFSRTIIQILPIFESEAVPADSFINALNAEFDARFEIAFIQAFKAN